VRHEVEVRGALADPDPGRAAEVVDRKGVDSGFGEPQRQLLVVGMEAADVGEDDDGRPAGLLGPGEEPGEALTVAGPQDDLLAVESAAGDRLDRRPAVEVEAHGQGSPEWR